MSTYSAVLALSFLSLITTVLGVLLAVLIRSNSRAIALGIGFSAGIMLLISGMELLPEACANVGARDAALAALLGGAFLWLANAAIPHVHLTAEHGLDDARLAGSASMVAMGLILHDTVEGFAMANAFISSPSLGVMTAIAIALHNLPEEFAIAVQAVRLRSTRFLLGAAALSALAEPAGALAGLLATSAYAALNSYFLAVAAGAMIFVSCHELFPMARRYGRFGWFTAGFALSVAVFALLAFGFARMA
jgi:ZIP family zinc transporter